MNDTYRVMLTQEAFLGIKEIAAYIREESPLAAASVAESLLNAIDSFETMPTRFRRVGTSRKRRTPVHACSVRPFIIYYRIDEQPRIVYVLKVIHGAGRQPKRFP